MIVFYFITSLVRWVLFLLALIFLVLWPLLCKSIYKNYSVHRFFIKMSRLFVWISGVRLTVTGQENIDPDQTYIVTFNHFNFFDHFFLYAQLGLKLAGLEKEQHAKIPIYGSFMKIAGIIPIPQRGNTEKALEGLERAKTKMKEEGYSILIAPEGTRCREGKLGSFKKGAFFMAIQTQSPILPVVYSGNMYHFHGRGRFILRPCDVTLTILPAIQTKNMQDSHANVLREDLRKTYVDHVGESYL